MHKGSAAVTIVARNYLAYVRTLMASLAQAEPSIDRYVFVVDAVDAVDAAADVGPASMLAPADIFDFEYYAGLAYSYDVTELSTCVKPFVLRHLLARGYERAFYFDPDIEVFGSLDPVVDPLRDADIVLTPHVTEPIPLDGALPDEVVLLKAGAYNLGFIGFANTPAASAVLDWWAQRLERFCVNDVAAGLFTDQKWIDLVPGMVDRVAIVRNRGCNVAYWNLHERSIDPLDIERLTSGERIVFYHYSGFDVRRPARLSKHQTRIDVANEPGLAALLERYAERVLANGHATSLHAAYGFACFSNGVPLDRVSRALLRAARIEGHRFPDPGDVFAEPSAWRYLNEWTDAATPPARRLTRFLYELWRSRADLRGAFPDPLGTGNAAYVHWLRIDPTSGVDRAYLAEAELRSIVHARVPDDVGVNVAGYFRTESGVGESGRAHVVALRAAGVPTRLIDFSAHAPSRDRDTSLAERDDLTDQPINLVCVNADQVAKFVEETGEAFFRGRYSIGSWWWELSQFPDTWNGAFRWFDEIWVGTQFIASAIARASPIPVVLVPPVVSVGSVRLGRKRDFGLAEDETTFLFMFDYLSVLARKNPLGVIDAFREAFPDARDRVRLVLKSINAEADPAGREEVLAAVGDDHRITLMQNYFTRQQKNELLGACDAYVSLHRSEGFGYTLAEAMALGKPVIATSWSGPADFITVSNSYPVGYELVEVGRDHGPYGMDQVWAEPDREDAVRAMRAVHDRPAQARARAQRGRHDVLSRYGAPAVARVVGDRIAHIGERLVPVVTM